MAENASAEGRARWAVGLLALLAAAAATRFFRLGVWPLFGDEYYTLYDSRNLSFSVFGRPLLYGLNHYLVRPLLGLEAFGLRLLPALFGVAGVAAVAEAGRRLIGWRAGLLAGALAVLSPWHLAMSQFARYYTLVFLLAAVSPAALYLGVRERSRGWLAAGGTTTVVAWFAHPTAVLPVAGFLLWLAGWAVTRADGRRRRLLLGGVTAAAVVGLLAGAALLSQWASLGQGWGIGGASLAVSYGVRLAAGPSLAAAGGVALLWIDGRREVALFLAAAVGVPLALLALLGKFVPVHTGYLFATAPYALVAGGAFVDGTIRRIRDRAPRWVVGTAVLGAVVSTGLPSFVSHYVDGGKADFRRAARHVAERAGPNDLVLADQTAPFRVYADGLDPRPLKRDSVRLDSLRSTRTHTAPPGDLWLVPYIHSEGGFGMEGLGPIRPWVWRNCRLTLRDAPVRIDHVRNIVEVWRCPPTGADSERGPTAADGREPAGTSTPGG